MRYWTEANHDQARQDSGAPGIVLYVLGSAEVKAARQFRTVIELCQRGEDADATVIARTMFETALVVGFVSCPRLRLCQFDGAGKRRPLSKIRGPLCGQELRTQLIMAHDALYPERDALRHAATPGMKRQVRVATKIAHDEAVRYLKKRVVTVHG